MQKLCCVCTNQQFSAILEYFVTSLPPYLHHFSSISDGNCISYEYIAVYVDEVCIAAESPSAIIQIFKSKNHLKVKGDGKLTYHLGADYFEDPDGTFVSQPKKYIDKLADTYKRLFNEDPPKCYKTPTKMITHS